MIFIRLDLVRKKLAKGCFCKYFVKNKKTVFFKNNELNLNVFKEKIFFVTQNNKLKASVGGLMVSDLFYQK